MISAIPLPALLALLSACLFALSDQISNRGLDTIDPRTGAVVSVAASAACFWVAAPWLMDTAALFTTAAALFALVGVFRPALSMNLALIGIQYLGPTLAGTFSGTTLIWGGLLAVSVLGEQLTLPVALGTASVAAGILMTSLRPRGVVRHWPLWALLFPLGAAFIRGAAHIVTKFGYAQVPQPFLASLLSTTVSAIVVLAAFRLRGGRFKSDRAGKGGGYIWLAIGGLLNGASIFSLNTALEHGTVVTVLPVSASTPVFTLALGLLVFRRETITWRTVATIALIVPGVILVCLR